MQLSLPGLETAPDALEPVEEIEVRVVNYGDVFNSFWGFYMGRGDTAKAAVNDLLKRIENENAY